MDFLFTPEQDAAAELAAQILKDKATNERMKAVEAAGDRFDRDLWATLGAAFDWNELDLTELCRVLVEVGRTVAPVPLAVHGPSALLLSEHEIAPGDRLLTAAVAEPHAHLPAEPTVTATADGTITGTKTLARAGMAADAFLVTATGPTGVGVYLVDAAAASVTREPQHTSDGDTTALVTFAGAPSTVVTATAAR
jgi:alkylation response protein AidB-like acyl-CoA dehydrogenase